MLDLTLKTIQTLPEGVLLYPMKKHLDERGSFTEIFRQEWALNIEPIQWNVVHSEANVLRGVHAHKKHADYLTIIEGKASIALIDLRKKSPTHSMSNIIEVSGQTPTGIVIPPGVAHGFYFHTDAIHIYAVSEYWDLTDELACHWSDSALNIHWPFTGAPNISTRDEKAGSMNDMVKELHR